MSFDKNIVTYMKQNFTSFESINDETLLIKEFEKYIATIFNNMEDTNDFLILINTVNKAIYTKSTPIKITTLQYHAFHNKNKYTLFEIPKKSGGTRTIYTPKKSLKNIQTTINVILQCIYKPQMPVHGFRKNRSVVSGAKQHVGKNYVYNIDLKEFFPSIHKARIEKRLQLPPFNLNNEKTEISTLIARLTTHKAFECILKPSKEEKLISFEDGDIKEFSKKDMPKEIKSKIYVNSFKPVAILPQGAPTSPIISNFICDRLDRRLMGLAKRFNAKHTRYADDITFSSMHNIYQNNSEFLKEMHKIINEQNFEINPKKTRLQKRGYRQEVTGIIVNDKVNVSRRYIKQLRAILYSIEKFGFKKAEEFFIKHYKKNGDYIKKNIPIMKDVLHGKLEYLKMVKGCEDSTYIKLKKRYNLIITPKKPDTATQKKDIISTEKDNNGSIEYNHNPKELIKLLKKIKSDEALALKWTTHGWDGSVSDKYSNMGDFLIDIKEEYDEINKKLESYSYRLNGKLYGFLFGNKEGHWGTQEIKIHWSSPELKRWWDDNKDKGPHAFEVPDKMNGKKNGKKIESFGDAIKIFKEEIQTRGENSLKNIFKGYKLDYRKDLNINTDKIKEYKLHTDIQWLKHGLNRIIKQIIDNKTNKDNRDNIRIITYEGGSKNSVEIKIIHIDSNLKSSSQELINNHGTDFNQYKEKFCSLCDFGIEAHCSDGNFFIPILTSNKEEDKKKIDKPDGFTYVLRFYK